MTIPSTARKAGPLLGTGAQTAWPFTFKVFAAADVAVTIADSLGIETALVLDADYSVTLNVNQETSPGGTITYPISGTPLPVGSVLSIVGDLDYDQPLDLPSGGNFSPLALENELDRTVMQIQQLREVTNRALQVPVTSNADSTLPAPEAQKILGWDVNGTGLQNYNIPDLFSGAVYADWIAQTFTGTGAQTLFVLQRAPGAVGNCDVSVDGQTYVPNVDFSLSGATLTFTVAPIVGAEILVRYGSAATQVASTFSTETQTATAGQTIFTLANLLYNPGANALAVYVNGLRMVSGVDFLETDNDQVTFTSGLSLADEVLFIAGRTINESIDASSVSYLPAGTGAVATTVQTKLRETVSVKDFGAVGDGVTNDTAAIQAAVDAVTPTGGAIYFPVPAIYRVTAQINVTSNYAVSFISEMGPDNNSSPDSYISIGASIAGAVFNVAARGGSIRRLWFRDPTSVLGVSQGTSAVNAALKLSTFGMGKVEDCAFDGILGSAIEIDSMIRGHIVRPHIRDCGTPTKPALWLNPQVALGAGQIEINAPHIETCYGEYLYVGQNAIDTKIIAGQFEADTSIANTCKYFIYNWGDRTKASSCGFNRNTETQFYARGSRAQIDNCTFSAASGAASNARVYLQGSFNQLSNCLFNGTAADVNTSIQDVGGNNFFTGCHVYFGGNVILGANSVWAGGGCYDLKTTQAYCIEGASNATVTGAYISAADVAGGIKAISGMAVNACNVISNAGIGIRCETSTATISGNRSTGNTAGNYSFTAYPHGYSPNANYSGDGVYPLQASTTWNPASLANGASESVNVTVTGAAVGDSVDAGFPMIVGGSGQNGMQISASVYTANTVKVTITNNSGGAVDLDSGTLVVKVTKQ